MNIQEMSERDVALINARKGKKVRNFNLYKPYEFKKINVNVDDVNVVDLYKLVYSICGIKLKYSQVLIVYSALSNEYRNVFCCTSVQYGKTLSIAIICVLLAMRGEKVTIVAKTDLKVKRVFEKVVMIIKQLSKDYIKMFDVKRLSKFERLGTSLSSSVITSKSGGMIQGVTANDTNSKSAGSTLYGLDGYVVIDEAGELSNAVFGELLPRTVMNNTKIICMSNPHKRGFFTDNLENNDERDAVIWADVSLLRQENFKTKEEMEELYESIFDFDKARYWYCEVPERNSDSIFPKMEVYDSDNDFGFMFAGIDTAYTGKDKISISIIGLKDGKMYVVDVVEVNKGDWEDVNNAKKITSNITSVLNKYKVSAVGIDSQGGTFINIELKRYYHNRNTLVFNVNFDGKTTKTNNKTYENLQNKRAEMYVFLSSMMYDEKIYFKKEHIELFDREMEVTEIEFSATGKRKIKAKEKIKAELGNSPDSLDSLVLALESWKQFAMKGGRII